MSTTLRCPHCHCPDSKLVHFTVTAGPSVHADNIGRTARALRCLRCLTIYAQRLEV